MVFPSFLGVHGEGVVFGVDESHTDQRLPDRRKIIVAVNMMPTFSAQEYNVDWDLHVADKAVRVEEDVEAQEGGNCEGEETHVGHRKSCRMRALHW